MSPSLFQASGDNTPASVADAGDIGSSVAYFQRFSLPREASLLDIGTRYGSFLQRLHAQGYSDLYGLDVEAGPLCEGHKTYPALRGRLLHYDGAVLPFAADSFDAVTMFDVIEHVPAISPFLGEVHRVLRSGGLFIFQTPNLFVNVPWEIVQRRSLTFWRTYHVSLQTLWSLRRLLGEVGFGDVTVEKYNVLSTYRLELARSVLGPPGPFLLRLAACLPLAAYPNFWGSARAV